MESFADLPCFLRSLLFFRCLLVRSQQFRASEALSEGAGQGEVHLQLHDRRGGCPDGHTVEDHERAQVRGRTQCWMHLQEQQ